MKTTNGFAVLLFLLMISSAAIANMYAKGIISLGIEILSPENKAYSINSIPLDFTVFEPTSWIGYSLNDEMNVTISGNTTLTDLPDGSHSIVVYANDTIGNMVTSDVVYFTIDTTPPDIMVISPENITYSANSVALNFTVNEPTSWIGYSLDEQTNATIIDDTILSGLTDAVHNVIVYANDSVGNMGSSATVDFSVDTTPPDIANVVQTPSADNVLPDDEVQVAATVTDAVSGVKQVTLNYTNGNGTWIATEMTNTGSNVWNGTIPAFPYDTNVTYVIIAEDNVGNIISTEDLGYEYQYPVIPEFSSIALLSLFIAATLLSTIVYKYKKTKSFN